MEKKPEKFLIFTTDSACFECVPEGECDSASHAFMECMRLQKKNQYANYLIKCPDYRGASYYLIPSCKLVIIDVKIKKICSLYFIILSQLKRQYFN